MQVVGHLVGLHADQGRLDAVDGEEEVVEGDADQRLVEDAPRQREDMGPERTAPPHGVFPEPRLRLVDAERDRVAHRCAVVLGVEPLVVEAVPGLVEHAEHGVAEVVGLVADGDPAVARPDPGAERVRRGVEPPAVEVEADRRGHRLAEDPLAIDRIAGRVPQQRRIGPDPAPEDRLDQRDELAPQRREEPRDLDAGGARLVFVEQGVVGDRPAPHARGLALLQVDDLFEPGPEVEEVVLLP